MRHNCGGFGNICELPGYNCGSLATIMNVEDTTLAQLQDHVPP